MIVQKFGGSSVGTPEKIRSVARRIARARESGDQVVAVVSAMGDTTDDLVALAREVSPVLHAREMDMLLSAGERVSMALLSMGLRDCGQEAISFTGSQSGIITDENHTRARILEIRPFRIEEELKRGKVVIVAGFQGVSRSKEVTTLGRGGSDTTAVALAAALKADRCEIYTDVAGVYSADPRVVPEARHYARLPLELVLEMSVKGAQVMHARSIEIARERKLAIRVAQAHAAQLKNSEKEDGTMLVPESQMNVLELPKIVAVTSKRLLRSLQFSKAQAPKILGELARDAVLVHSVTLTAAGGLLLLVCADEAAGLLERHAQAVAPETFAAASVIGYQLQQNAGVASQVIEILASNGIKVSGLTCHPSSITVWFQDSQAGDVANSAVKCLHDALVASRGE